MNVIDRIEKCMNSLERAKREYENGDKRLALGSLDWCQDRLTASKCLLIAEIEEEDALNDQRKQKDSYDKATKLNGDALKRLKDN